MKSMYDCYTLEDGSKIPCMGFGTYNAKDGDNLQIIRDAIESGYRYFDTASLYETERFLGQAIKESGIPREEFYIVSKLWHDERGYAQAKEALERSLDRLQMDYLDLYLIHWPKGSEEEEDWQQVNLDTWQAMEEMQARGLIKGAGLSNFLPHHIDPILENSNMHPLVDQLELHPGHIQSVAVNYCKAHNILPQAWSPIGRSAMLENPLVLQYAQKYGKSAAQICLRYLVQKKIVPLVKTSTKARMVENASIFDFEIERADMQLMDCMPQTQWLGEHPDFAIPKRSSNFDQ